ncbi:hypothetical protein Tco_0604175 [Tanacetum coccineum]
MVVPSAGAKPWREKKEWRTTPCPMTRVLAMAHHSMVRAKVSRLWLITPLNSGALPNLVPNSIFLTFFSMARAYGTTTPSALSEIYALFLETRKKPLTPRRNLTRSTAEWTWLRPEADQILDHVSSLKALIKQHNERFGTLIEPIHLSFGDEDGSDKGKGVEKGVGDAEDEDLRKPYKEVLRSPFTT